MNFFENFYHLFISYFADPVRGRGVLHDQLLVPRGLLLHLLPARPHLTHPARHVRARRVPAHAQAPIRAQASGR